MVQSSSPTYKERVKPGQQECVVKLNKFPAHRNLFLVLKAPLSDVKAASKYNEVCEIFGVVSGAENIGTSSHHF